MKEKIDTFWKKKENIVILIGVTVFLVVFMNYFYFHIIKSYENGPVRLVNTLISNAAENELKEGDILTQTFSGIKEFDGFHIKMFSANGTKQDKIEVKLFEQDTNKEIQTWTYDFTQLVESKMYDFGLQDNIQEKEEKSYCISVTVLQEKENSELHVFSTGVNAYQTYEQGEMAINGEVQTQDTIFDVYQYKNGIYGFLQNIYIVLFVLCIAITIFIVYFGFYRKEKIEKIFVPVVIVWGIIYMIILPPFSSPDEPIHFGTAYKISNEMLGKKALGENNVVVMRKDDAEVAYGTIPTVKTYEYTLQSFFDGVQDTTPTEWMHSNLNSKNIITHLPGAIGISIARVFGFGSIPLIYLGRIMNLLFYVILVCLAIKIAPFGKMVFFALSMTPMMLELISSYSYDAIVNALAFLSIALLLRAIYGEEKVGIKEIAILVVLAALLGPAKVVYSLIFGLCILIPKEKFSNRWIQYGSIALIFAAVIFSNVYVNLGTVTQMSGTDSAVATTQNVVEQYSMKWCIQNPIQACKIYWNTTRVLGMQYFRTMFGSLLGWLELPVASIAIYGFALLTGASFFFEKGKEKKVSIWHRVVTLAILFGVYVLVLFSMMSGCTPFGMDVILGVQGRYFLAVIPLFLLVLYNKKIQIKHLYEKYFVLFFHIGNIYVIFNLFATIAAR